MDPIMAMWFVDHLGTNTKLDKQYTLRVTRFFEGPKSGENQQSRFAVRKAQKKSQLRNWFGEGGIS